MGVTYGIVASAGIDYITATGTSTSAQVFLRECGLHLIGDAKSGGENVKPWAAYGYRGSSCGGVSLGIGDPGTILRVSGGTASDVGREIVQHADSVSRIDLQSTVRFNRDVSGLARHHASEIRRSIRAGAANRTTRLERTFGRGDTLYVGSRSSNYYGRVYDKGRESKQDEYRGCWRYEVECKGDGALRASQRIKAFQDTSLITSDIVHKWFTERGIGVRYRPESSYGLKPLSRPDSDAERKLIWLRSQVSPVLSYLSQWYDEDGLIEWLFRGGNRPRLAHDESRDVRADSLGSS